MRSTLADLRWLARRELSLGPVLAARRAVGIAWLKYGKPALRLDANLGEGCSSEVAVDVLIPAGEADADVLPYTIRSIRTHVRHPIGELAVVAAPSGAVAAACADQECRLVDERDVVPVGPSDIGLVVNGIDRSAWIFQQLLKLAADQVVRGDHILVVDADTVFVRPHVFIRSGKVVHEHAAEYHRPYFELYRRLLGERPSSALSFVVQSMLWEREVLVELRRAVEAATGESWLDAILGRIDRSEWSPLSEYELYGNFALRRRRGRITRNWAFNRVMPRSDLALALRPGSLLGDRTKSASFHSYVEE